MIRLTFGEILSCLVAIALGVCLCLWAVEQDRRAEPPIRAERPAMAAPAPLKVAPAPKPTSQPPPDAPAYVQGGGVLQVAVGPTKKGLTDCRSSLWSILGEYKGESWRPQIATVKWFGGDWTIVFDGVAPDAAEKMCPWLGQLGWGWRDSYCDRICTFHPEWFSAKP